MDGWLSLVVGSLRAPSVLRKGSFCENRENAQQMFYLCCRQRRTKILQIKLLLTQLSDCKKLSPVLCGGSQMQETGCQEVDNPPFKSNEPTPHNVVVCESLSKVQISADKENLPHFLKAPCPHIWLGGLLFQTKTLSGRLSSC